MGAAEVSGKAGAASGAVSCTSETSGSAVSETDSLGRLLEGPGEEASAVLCIFM